MIYEFSAKEIVNLISNGKSIGSGVYGWVYEYDDKTLIKIYYKDIFSFFLSKNIEELDREIDINLFVENEMKEIYDGYVTKLERLVSIINWLKSVNCSLIKGIAVYKGYPVGIFLNYYKGYSKLGDVFFELDSEKKVIVLNKIKLLLDKLINYGICPLDLKEDNILVDIDSLDVQFIDLDGSETRYETEEYLNEFDYIKKNAIKSYNIMVERLNRANCKSK